MLFDQPEASELFLAARIKQQNIKTPLGRPREKNDLYKIGNRKKVCVAAPHRVGFAVDIAPLLCQRLFKALDQFLRLDRAVSLSFLFPSVYTDGNNCLL